MPYPSNQCVDRAFYARQYPDGTFEEARAVLIGKYVEKELDAEIAARLKTHLNECSCCSQFLEELQNLGDFAVKQELIPYAVCPSNEAMDTFAFDRARLPSAEADRIEAHLRECPLCKEEMQWLREVEEQRVTQFPRSRSWVHSLSAVAAVFFFLLSSVLLWQKFHTLPPEQQLQALAHIKEPAEINFASLEQTSVTLPTSVEETYSDGVTSFRRGDFLQASRQFQQVLDQNPQHSASLYLLGYCFYKLNQPQKAFQLCDRAEAMHPHSYERCMSLVNIALKTGHYARALEEITTLYHEAPNQPEIRDMYFKISGLTRGRLLKM